MINKRRISRALYFSVVILGAFLLFVNLFTSQAGSNVQYIDGSETDSNVALIAKQMADHIKTNSVMATEASNSDSTKHVAPLQKNLLPMQKSIFLNLIPSVDNLLSKTAPEKSDKSSQRVDTGLAGLYNKIAVRKINNIFTRTMEQEKQGLTETENVRVKSGNSSVTNATVPLCSEFPELIGFHSIDINRTLENTTESDVETLNPDIQNGHWAPRSCTARHKVAIVIPFRDRERHLTVLLNYLLPVWKRQELYFKVFVVEQFGDEAFNKGRVMNAGFLEALKQDDFHCFVFHDVDLIPMNDYNMYSCPQNPRHMSVLVDELDNQYPYDELAGGVLSIRTEHFQLVNGYNNLFWGWGAEDDDMGFRVQRAGLRLERPSSTIAQYKMIRHTKRKTLNQERKVVVLHNKKQRSHLNGVNSVSYDVIANQYHPLYQHIIVDVGKYDNVTLI